MHPHARCDSFTHLLVDRQINRFGYFQRHAESELHWLPDAAGIRDAVDANGQRRPLLHGHSTIRFEDLVMEGALTELPPLPLSTITA